MIRDWRACRVIRGHAMAKRVTTEESADAVIEADGSLEIDAIPAKVSSLK